MKIECPYPDCRQRIAICEEDFGTEAHCPSCGNVFTCPSRDELASGLPVVTGSVESNPPSRAPAQSDWKSKEGRLPLLIRVYGHFYWITAAVVALFILFNGGGIVPSGIVMGIGAVLMRMGRSLARGSKQAAQGTWVLFLVCAGLPVFYAIWFDLVSMPEQLIKLALISFGLSLLLFGIPAIACASHWKKFK